jgi:hypothetical protein
MTRMRIAKVLALTVLVGASVSCGDVVRQGRSPVYLVIDSLGLAKGDDPTKFANPLLSDVDTNGTVFNDVGSVVLRASLKDLGSSAAPTSPTAYNEVTINRIHIEYRRADGHQTPGVDVPFPWDAAATGTIKAGASLVLTFEAVRHDAKLESPLLELKDNLKVITTITDITFYGRDQAGNEVSVTGTVQIDFGNFADK